MKFWIAGILVSLLIVLIVATLMFDQSDPTGRKIDEPEIILPTAVAGGSDVPTEPIAAEPVGLDAEAMPQAFFAVVESNIENVEFKSELAPSQIAPRSVEPTTLDATEATQLVADNEWVIGVSIEDHQRAYPLRYLQRPYSQVIDDQLGEVPIVVSFCDVSQMAMVFDRRARDLTLRFTESKRRWQNRRLIQDRETESLWVQAWGRAMEGQMTGATLPQVPAVLVTWASWKGQFPKSSVMVDLESEKPIEPASFNLGEMVAGIIVQQNESTYTVESLREKPLNNVNVGDVPLVVIYHEPSQGIYAYIRPIELAQAPELLLEQDSIFEPKSGNRWSVFDGTGHLDESSQTGEGGTLDDEQLSLRRVPVTICTPSAWDTFHGKNPVSSDEPGGE